jgi:hypothetical protein
MGVRSGCHPAECGMRKITIIICMFDVDRNIKNVQQWQKRPGNILIRYGASPVDFSPRGSTIVRNPGYSGIF